MLWHRRGVSRRRIARVGSIAATFLELFQISFKLFQQSAWKAIDGWVHFIVNVFPQAVSYRLKSVYSVHIGLVIFSHHRFLYGEAGQTHQCWDANHSRPGRSPVSSVGLLHRRLYLRNHDGYLVEPLSRLGWYTLGKLDGQIHIERALVDVRLIVEIVF